MWNILTHIYHRKYGTDEPICKEGTETQAWRTNLWTQQGNERVGQTEKASLTYIHYHV